MELLLTAEEHEYLVTLLEQRHRQLMNEIWHTEHRDFKELLRRQERLLESIVSRLRNVAVYERR